MASIAAFESWPVQNDMLQILHQRFAEDAIPHAMLFVGEPKSTATLTEYLERILLCAGPAAPCGVCAACRLGSLHPDAIRVEPGDNGTIKTAQVEEVQERLSRRSHTGGRLVYTLPGIDTLTVVAANRLLKTLEEPRPAVFALLTAVNLRQVLPTILSRCFVFPVQNAESPLLWDDLPPARHETDGNEPVDSVFAAGSKAMIQWVETLILRKEEPLLLADAFMGMAGELSADDLLWLLAVYFRDLAHITAGEREHVQFFDFIEDLQRQSQVVRIQALYEAMQVVLETRKRIKSHVAMNLNMEQMCIRLREVLKIV